VGKSKGVSPELRIGFIPLCTLATQSLLTHAEVPKIIGSAVLSLVLRADGLVYPGERQALPQAMSLQFKGKPWEYLGHEVQFVCIQRRVENLE
jgi:hypothetical protein